MAVALPVKAAPKRAALQEHVVRRGTWPNDYFGSTFELRNVFAPALLRKVFRRE
jgi:hypothetical protein